MPNINNQAFRADAASTYPNPPRSVREFGTGTREDDLRRRDSEWQLQQTSTDEAPIITPTTFEQRRATAYLAFKAATNMPPSALVEIASDPRIPRGNAKEAVSIEQIQAIRHLPQEEWTERTVQLANTVTAFMKRAQAVRQPSRRIIVPRMNKLGRS